MARRRRRFSGSSPLERFLILIVIAIIIGISAGLLLPQISETVGGITGQYQASGGAADALNRLTVADGAKPASQYRRDAFGFREYDPDGNGCDSRNDTLARDLKNVTYRNAERCKVESGTLNDPYTGKTIQFRRGATTSTAVQIDHVVALNDAWRSGASTWNTHKRYEFANDPYNLLAVDGPTNEDKGDANAADWLPPNKQYDCAYVARQIGVKSKYGLSVTSREKTAMLKVLHDCPSQPLPTQ
ncbi:HNH endonuclease family protein [Bifidobacterium simiarum]|uniref:HNH endonuclease family protein n=1 Tax=Bifidobacterium simiarum TaxID=2045441 RepID=UPI001BDC4094|nr:HNH endonuclease family protein [Bifidobacterium simiarum]MBT1166982.1 HNH endonuclease [Bifidobacterium simiarum]